VVSEYHLTQRNEAVQQLAFVTPVVACMDLLVDRSTFGHGAGDFRGLMPSAIAATKKFDGSLVDERHVPQIQNQRCPDVSTASICSSCWISSAVSIRPLSVNTA
jgi:hypothetical protein